MQIVILEMQNSWKLLQFPTLILARHGQWTLFEDGSSSIILLPPLVRREVMGLSELLLMMLMRHFSEIFKVSKAEIGTDLLS